MDDLDPKETEKYYEAMWDLFASEGWKFLMEDLQKLRDRYNDLSIVPDARTLDKRLGQLDILDLLLNRKKACEAVWKQIQEADNGSE